MKPFFLVVIAILRSLLAIGGESGAFTNTVAQSTLPQGPGLAAAFKADSGIATHAGVIFADDFDNVVIASEYIGPAPRG
jgi:hypothetical protein